MTLTDRSGRAIEIPERDIIQVNPTRIGDTVYSCVTYAKRIPGDRSASHQTVIVKESPGAIGWMMDG